MKPWNGSDMTPGSTYKSTKIIRISYYFKKLFCFNVNYMNYKLMNSKNIISWVLYLFTIFDWKMKEKVDIFLNFLDPDVDPSWSAARIHIKMKRIHNTDFDLKRPQTLSRTSSDFSGGHPYTPSRCEHRVGGGHNARHQPIFNFSFMYIALAYFF